MNTIALFDTTYDLAKLTGLPNRKDDLEAAGFDLERWSFGIMLDEDWSDYENFYMEWLLKYPMIRGDYPSHVIFRGKHFYIFYYH